MYVLGISCFYHDAAACLLKDGAIVAAAEEERFSRIKHDSRFPLRAIDYCLREAGIQPNEIDHVAFYEKPLLKFERILSSYLETFPASRRAFVEAMKTWLGDKLWTRSLIRQKLRYRKDIVFGEHHLSHASSAFLVSPFDEAAVLTADGVGEWTTTAIGLGSGTGLELLREVRYPHSLGLLYSAFTAYLGFEVNEGEYKVMGMSAYGRPRYVDAIQHLIDVAADGSYQLDMSYFEYHRALRTYNQRFVDLLGPARAPDAELDQRHADVAASIQAVLEEVLLRMARHLRSITGSSKLCMAGGVALNGLANSKIYKEAGFDELFIQPAAGDSGGAIGAAAFLYHSVLDQPRVSPMRHAYLGPSFSDAEIATFLERNDIPATRLEPAELPSRVADLIAGGQVVGWFQGRMEFGPRALGSRSILADPGIEGMKDVVNEKIKHRERFRPFAPSVIAEEAGRYFDLDCESPYMLHIVPVRPEMRAALPAITHVDGTARLQTVSRETNPLYYDLIQAFARRSGTPVVLNTSFNVRGEPIVCTPDEAYNCFAHTDIDHLVLGSYLLSRESKRRLMPYAGRKRVRETDEVIV